MVTHSQGHKVQKHIAPVSSAHPVVVLCFKIFFDDLCQERNSEDMIICKHECC